LLQPNSLAREGLTGVVKKPTQSAPGPSSRTSELRQDSPSRNFCNAFQQNRELIDANQAIAQHNFEGHEKSLPITRSKILPAQDFSHATL